MNQFLNQKPGQGKDSSGAAMVINDAERAVERYRRFRSYVGWDDSDAQRLASLADRLDPHLPPVVNDFYATIHSEEETRRVITGGPEQVQRLKESLLAWLRALLRGPDDEHYVATRWRVGLRHQEIGLDPVYTQCAMSRIRTGLTHALAEVLKDDVKECMLATASLDKRLDLDQAIISDAFHGAYSERLQRTERLATLGQVAGGIAHELRNPLNVIRTSVYYLTNARHLTTEKQAEHMQRIERNVGLADAVISALSDFAKLPSPSLKPVPLDQALAMALEANQPGPEIEVETRIESANPHVLADPNQLQIVLGNLIRNAIEAMPNGGRLTLRASPGNDQKVLIEIKDNGVGISPEDLSRVTEPLFSTKARGLGLGLAITKAILDKSGGSLSLSSDLGVGSSFLVILPASAATEENVR